MPRRNPTGAFADHWVFPGGRVDPGDADPDRPDDELAAARRAAVREAREEASLEFDIDALVTLSQWVPPPESPRRFSTWFFLAPAPAASAVTIDGTEIHDHAWLRPADAIARRDAGEIELAPPTWVTLSTLATAADLSAAITEADGRDPVHYTTRVATAEGRITVAMWHGDAGYDDGDVDRPGLRHRLLMLPDGWRFEHTL